jgi:hypothetical protein
MEMAERSSKDEPSCPFHMFSNYHKSEYFKQSFFWRGERALFASGT